MNVQIFSDGVAKLVALPQHYRDQAINIAAGLTDEDRLALLQELTEMNKKLVEADREEERAVSSLENVVAQAEKQMRSSKRKQEESGERQKSMRDVEGKFKNKS